MKKRAEIRKRKKINEKRLAAYTAAAGAALLAAGPANAAINYSGVVDISVRTGGGTSALIDIDGDGTDDLGFWGHKYFVHRSRILSHWYSEFNVSGGFSNLNGISFAGPSGLPSNFGPGSIIDAVDDWTNNNGKLFSGKLTEINFSSGCLPTSFGWCWINDSVNNGKFTRGNPGYLGIRFNPGDGTKYGWIHVASVERIDSWGPPYEFLHSEYKYNIDGYAYDDSGEAIAAGATTVVPEPTSMALFAAGAATIMAKRRMKKK